jgi:hypothetical protein
LKTRLFFWPIRCSSKKSADYIKLTGYAAPARGVTLLVSNNVEDILPKLREAARAVSEAEKEMALPAERL